MFSKSSARANDHDAHTDDDWIEPQRPGRDWKKVFLVFGLGTLSWVATYIGMLELIEANMGTLDFMTRIVVGFSVAMLMTMIIWLLDQMFAPHPFGVKLAYIAGYIFLTLISVGFGFGFYWKVLESRSEASRSAESAVSQVQASLVAGAARLDQLQSTLDQLAQISQQKAIEERDHGTTCPNSRPGDGPRRRLRDDDAARFGFASNFVKGRGQKVKADMRALDGDLKKITTRDASTFDKTTGTRNKFLQALSRKLELTATSFNAFRTDPQLRQIRSELADRANRSTFPTGRGNGTFSCPDGQLQSALLGVVRAIDQLPELDKPEIATVEGAQAVVEAFRRLTATAQGALTLKLPPSADELRALQTKAVRSVSSKARVDRNRSYSGLSQGGLSQRDYIPLSIAVFVDLCLLLVSIGRPMNRLGGLVPKMREAERGPVYQILSKFDDIHRDQKIREKFEVFRHVVFDFNGDYYVAVPLDAPRNRNPEEVSNLQLEAHLLANLFASFEKEKIFSRVYNPLLSRKTIQKKLWRQGSKFASSQAFRTYRFRDGAWSEIILGAVMGAARRARAERIRTAQEAGPQLDFPAKAAAAAEPANAARAHEIIAETIGAETRDVREQLTEPPLATPVHANSGEAGRSAVATADDDAAAMAVQFGPYANYVARENREANREATDPAARTAWPYHKKPEPPGEADVELMPANSNTSPADRVSSSATSWPPVETPPGHATTPVHDSQTDPSSADNVILMPPRPSASLSDAPEAREPVASAAAPPVAPAPAYTDALAHALTAPVDDPSSLPHAAEPDTDHSPSPELLSPEPEPVRQTPPPLPATMTNTDVAENPPASPSGRSEHRMTVRITQRTADFEIPTGASQNGHPIEIVRAGMHSAFTTSQQQDAPAREAPSPQALQNDPQPAIPGPSAADGDATVPEPLEVKAEPGLPTIVEPERTAAEPLETVHVPFPEDTDIEEISRRFAPQREIN